MHIALGGTGQSYATVGDRLGLMRQTDNRPDSYDPAGSPLFPAFRTWRPLWPAFSVGLPRVNQVLSVLTYGDTNGTATALVIVRTVAAVLQRHTYTY